MTTVGGASTVSQTRPTAADGLDRLAAAAPWRQAERLQEDAAELLSHRAVEDEASRGSVCRKTWRNFCPTAQ